MNTTREALYAAGHGHPRERTGVRFVLTNAADPSQADAYSAWYDDYEHAIIRPGLVANAFRFENPNAAGTETDPRYAALYDIVSPDPAAAWPATENSPEYPTHLFDDPRSRLVVPALRASYALTGSLEIDGAHGDLTGVHIILSDGGTDTARAQRAAALLRTGFFYAASRFRIIEGSPEPPACLEVFETDRQDPLTAYARAALPVQLTELVNEAPTRSRSSRPTEPRSAGLEWAGGSFPSRGQSMTALLDARRRDRSQLRRTMRELLDRDDAPADRRLILRAIDEAWTATARPPGAQRVAEFYLERPDVANRPGAYGV